MKPVTLKLLLTYHRLSDVSRTNWNNTAIADRRRVYIDKTRHEFGQSCRLEPIEGLESFLDPKSFDACRNCDVRHVK